MSDQTNNYNLTMAEAFRAALKLSAERSGQDGPGRKITHLPDLVIQHINKS